MYECDYTELERCLRTFMNEDGVDTELEITHSTSDTLRGYEVLATVEAFHTITFGMLSRYDSAQFELLINLRSGGVEVISKDFKLESVYNRVLKIYYDLSGECNLTEETREYFDYEIDRVVRMIEDQALEYEYTF